MDKDSYGMFLIGLIFDVYMLVSTIPDVCKYIVRPPMCNICTHFEVRCVRKHVRPDH